MTSAAGLESALKQAAIWVGANPDEVRVEPNLDFITEERDPKDLLSFAQAKKAGTPISWKSVHNWLRQNDFTEYTFDEELEQIDEEEDIEALSGGGNGLGEEGDINDPAMQAARDAAMQAAGQLPPGAGRPQNGGEEGDGDDEDG